jgi:hypothetical protein
MTAKMTPLLKPEIKLDLPRGPLEAPKHITFRPDPEDYRMIEELKEYTRVATVNKLLKKLIRESYKQNILHKGHTNGKV